MPIGPARFVGASITTTLLSLALLGGLLWSGVEAVVANVVATSAGAGLGYWLNRHWVWDRRHGGHRSAEIAGFWGLALAGLAISSLAVTLADGWAEAAHTSSAVATIAAVGANWASFLGLAVLKFLMSRRLYAPATRPG